MGTWEEISSTLTINDVELFASRMQEVGTSYGFAPLSDWGAQLGAQAATFDMGSMGQTLSEFPQVVEDLKVAC